VIVVILKPHILLACYIISRTNTLFLQDKNIVKLSPTVLDMTGELVMETSGGNNVPEYSTNKRPALRKTSISKMYLKCGIMS